jgi:hypothetical protein
MPCLKPQSRTWSGVASLGGQDVAYLWIDRDVGGANVRQVPDGVELEVAAGGHPEEAAHALEPALLHVRSDLAALAHACAVPQEEAGPAACNASMTAGKQN